MGFIFEQGMAAGQRPLPLDLSRAPHRPTRSTPSPRKCDDRASIAAAVRDFSLNIPSHRTEIVHPHIRTIV